jgi:beta-N-acetylglucosaminidase
VDDAKKSVASTEYDYYTNTWTIRDSSGWVTVHPDYLAYCMDPRNFLNAENIFMFESLSYNSTHNILGVNAIIKNSFMENEVADSDGSILNYSQAFMTIGEEVGVSPYHLASRIRQEQGTKGTSPLISGTYPGYEGLYNYFNYGAFGTPTSVLYANGLTYARNQGWTSRYLSLLGGSKLLAKNYINVGQDTLYFQKFNVVYKDKLYTHQYMTNVEAAISEGKTVAGAYADKTQSFVFEIPIYLNMPEEPVQFTASGNRNNYLASLDVGGLALTPTFDGASKEYSVIVDHAVDSVKVSAKRVVSASKVKGEAVPKRSLLKKKALLLWKGFTPLTP